MCSADLKDSYATKLTTTTIINKKSLIDEEINTNLETSEQLSPQEIQMVQFVYLFIFLENIKI